MSKWQPEWEPTIPLTKAPTADPFAHVKLKWVEGLVLAFPSEPGAFCIDCDKIKYYLLRGPNDNF